MGPAREATLELRLEVAFDYENMRHDLSPGHVSTSTQQAHFLMDYLHPVLSLLAICEALALGRHLLTLSASSWTLHVDIGDSSRDKKLSVQVTLSPVLCEA